MLLLKSEAAALTCQPLFFVYICNMAIEKRKNPDGGVYYFNTVTKKFSSESAYKKEKAAPLTKFKTRAGGKPSAAKCSTYGRKLSTKPTSTAGRNLKRCD